MGISLRRRPSKEVAGPQDGPWLPTDLRPAELAAFAADLAL